MAVEYGTIGIRLMGEWKPDQQYDLLNQVSHDGSSYLVHTKPPVGTLPTNLDYWQVSSLGTSKATANSVGTVKPDGTTTEVSTEGSLSVKTATQNTLGLVKGSNGIKVGTDGSIDVNTLFTQATELANIIAEEAISSVLGKISKAIAVTIGLNENAVLKSMLTNMDANDNTKINTAAFIHTLYERIGMGTELTAGANLTAVVEALNSNLTALNAITNGTVTIVIGTNVGSYLKKKGIGLCVLQLSITIPEGFTPWSEQKIATASFLPQFGFTENITLYSTGTGNSIEGRIGMNTTGEIYLYVAEVIPSGGLTIQKQIIYLT